MLIDTEKKYITSQGKRKETKNKNDNRKNAVPTHYMSEAEAAASRIMLDEELGPPHIYLHGFLRGIS